VQLIAAQATAALLSQPPVDSSPAASTLRHSRKKCPRADALPSTQTGSERTAHASVISVLADDPLLLPWSHCRSHQQRSHTSIARRIPALASLNRGSHWHQSSGRSSNRYSAAFCNNPCPIIAAANTRVRSRAPLPLSPTLL